VAFVCHHDLHYVAGGQQKQMDMGSRWSKSSVVVHMDFIRLRVGLAADEFSYVRNLCPQSFQVGQSMTGINELIERRLEAERKLIADWIASENKPGKIRFHSGELSAQEMRTVRAFMKFVEEVIRFGDYGQEGNK